MNSLLTSSHPRLAGAGTRAMPGCLLNKVGCTCSVLGGWPTKGLNTHYKLNQVTWRRGAPMQIRPPARLYRSHLSLQEVTLDNA